MRMQPLTPEPQGAGLGAPPFFGPSFHLLSGAEGGIFLSRVTLVTASGDNVAQMYKVTFHGADRRHMIISKQQARHAAQYMREAHDHTERGHAEHVPLEVVEQAMAAAASAPDVRLDRVRQAREWLDASEPDPYELADKMLLRIMCDRLR